MKDLKNKVNTFIMNREFKKAKLELMKAYNSKTELEDRKYILNRLAMVCKQLGSYEASKYYLEELMSISDEGELKMFGDRHKIILDLIHGKMNTKDNVDHTLLIRNFMNNEFTKKVLKLVVGVACAGIMLTMACGDYFDKIQYVDGEAVAQLSSSTAVI